MRRRISITDDVLFPIGRPRGHRRVRALADESLHPDLIEEMRSHGWDVIAVAESPRLSGKEDKEVWRLAVNWNRLLVTTDPDFASDKLFPLQNGPGILLLVGKTVAQQVDALMRAGPLIQFNIDTDKESLPWNKFIASARKL